MRYMLAFAFSLAAGPLLAWSDCDDLWFSRNQVYDQAGFCFSTPLAKVIFDNTGCIGKDVALDRSAQELVAFIRTREADLGCAVDTNRTELDVANLWMRQKLERPVALSEFASGCIGWNGAPFVLRTGPSDNSPALAEALPGDQIVWEYEAVAWPEDWSFITLYRDGEQVGLGWFRGAIDEQLCTATAG